MFFEECMGSATPSSSNQSLPRQSMVESSEDLVVHSSVFLISVGMQYHGYCANVGYTIIVGPSNFNQGWSHSMRSVSSSTYNCKGEETSCGKALCEDHGFWSE